LVINAVEPDSNPVQLFMHLKLTRATGTRSLAEIVKRDTNATPDVERESAKLSGR
jgi:hypothetical protein